MESNFEKYRKSITPEQRERIDKMKQQLLDSINMLPNANEMVHDMTDFDCIWKDEDFSDLSLKKEMVIATGVAVLFVVSLFGIKYFISR